MSGYHGVRIPADVERPDRILAGLTLRQLITLAVPVAVLWLAFQSLGTRVPLLVWAGIAVPVLAIAAVLALGRRDGMPLTALAAAGFWQLARPRHRTASIGPIPPAPAWADGAGRLPAPLQLPARAITEHGVIDLGRDGTAVIVACSTIHFALRTPAEQAGLVAAFAGWLNSLTSPVQIVVSAQRVDLAPLAARVEDAAPGLPHPALEQAARGHAAFLHELAASADLLCRQVLIVIREPAATAEGHAAARAVRVAEESVAALSRIGVTAARLDRAACYRVLCRAAAPFADPPEGLAAPDAVITAGAPR